jgi:hypothetical protein
VHRNVCAAASSVLKALISVMELTKMEFLSNFVSCIGGSSDFNSSKYLRRRDQSLKKRAKTNGTNCFAFSLRRCSTSCKRA